MASGSADWGCLWKVTSSPVVSSPAANPVSAFLIVKSKALFQPTLRIQIYDDLQERLRQNISLLVLHHWMIFFIIGFMQFQCCVPGELVCSLVTNSPLASVSHQIIPMASPAQPFGCDRRPMGSSRTSASINENQKNTFHLFF